MATRGYVASVQQVPGPPNTVAAAMVSATGSALDYPSDADVMRLSGATTAGAALAFAVNLASTSAAWPAAASTATTATTGQNIVIPTGESKIFRIPGDSTGFSLISGTSGIVTVEFWRAGG